MPDEDFKDITWLNTSGKEMTSEDWTDPETSCFGALLSAEVPHASEALLIVMNNHFESAKFALPDGLFEGKWDCLLDTATATGRGERLKAGALSVPARGLMLLHGKH